MNCAACGYENGDAARFCGDCVGSLARARSRPDCGTDNPPSQRFCNGCGRAMIPGLPSVPALRLYLELGATGHAARLQAKLASAS